MKHFSTYLRLFLFIALLAIACTSYAQTTATIDYRLYSTKAHPYMLPNVGEFTLLFKTGYTIYISITDMDKGSGDFYKNWSDRSSTKEFTVDTLGIDATDVGDWVLNYRKNSTNSTMKFHLHAQIDLQDQTIGSATYGNYPDFIWVALGGSAKISAGPNMASYKWKNYADAAFPFVANISDSVRTFSVGAYMGRANDGASVSTSDTITILEKPTINAAAKTLSFGSTVAGVSYSIMKGGAVVGTDTTWTQAANYVGDGNAKSFSLTDGIYKLWVSSDGHTAVYPYGNIVLGTATQVEKVNHSNINLYPNPMTESFSISGIEGESTVSVSDLNGKTMFSKQVLVNQKISVSTLPKGMYIAKIITAEGAIKRKIIKE